MNADVFSSNDGESGNKSLPILEETDARKVILLAPRRMESGIGLGCAVSLFIPAGVLCLPLISPNGQIHEPSWLWSSFLLLAIAGPVWVIWWSQTLLDTEHLLILEHNLITLRTKSFHQSTQELVDVSDETVGIGPGSGLTTDESAWKESGDSLRILIWGSSGSLSLDAEPNEYSWLRNQIHDWLQRHVTTSADEKSRRRQDTLPPRTENVEIEQGQVLRNEPPNDRAKEIIRKSPPKGLIAVSRESEAELLIHLAAGGPSVASFGLYSIGQLLFMTAFCLFLFLFVLDPDEGWFPIAIFGGLWLLTVVALCVWIRRLFEEVDLELTQNCLTIRRTIFGWCGTERITLGATPSAQLVVTEWRGSTPQPAVCVKGSDDEARFGTMLSDDEKRWLVMRLRAFLKLDLRANIFAEPEE